jgi:hypothetical protein
MRNLTVATAPVRNVRRAVATYKGRIISRVFAVHKNRSGLVFSGPNRNRSESIEREWNNYTLRLYICFNDCALLEAVHVFQSLITATIRGSAITGSHPPTLEKSVRITHENASAYKYRPDQRKVTIAVRSIRRPNRRYHARGRCARSNYFFFFFLILMFQHQRPLMRNADELNRHVRSLSCMYVYLCVRVSLV